MRTQAPVTSRHVTPRHVTSRHVTPRHVTSRHVTFTGGNRTRRFERTTPRGAQFETHEFLPSGFFHVVFPDCGSLNPRRAGLWLREGCRTTATSSYPKRHPWQRSASEAGVRLGPSSVQPEDSNGPARPLHAWPPSCRSSGRSR